MPPKNARKPNIKEDIVELQSQLKALNEDVQLIYGTVNVIEAAIKKISAAQEEQHEKTMSMISDFIEKSRPTTAIGESGGSNETNHTPSTKKVIPAPRVYKEVEGKTKGFTLRIVKDHIVQYVIKEANKELTDPEAEAQYQTMRDELNIALNVLESRVKKAITDTMSEEDRYEYQSDESIVDMKGYTWGSRSLARFRDIAIRSFEDMVLEATGVCESHWASSHMLEGTWNNRCKTKSPTKASKRKHDGRGSKSQEHPKKHVRFEEPESEGDNEDDYLNVAESTDDEERVSNNECVDDESDE
ncbi:hypothetical protein BJV82DRAFT_640455 [Fennellomyces sp. T-0311]|nr:hypothetical protein BJV82DRAFT_640455 [Fennellomyces sp. T-0311]